MRLEDCKPFAKSPVMAEVPSALAVAPPTAHRTYSLESTPQLTSDQSTESSEEFD